MSDLTSSDFESAYGQNADTSPTAIFKPQNDPKRKYNLKITKALAI